MFNVILKYPRTFGKTPPNFHPPFFKNINVSRDRVGPVLKAYADKEGILTQHRRMLKSTYFLETGTIITPLLLCCLDLRLTCTYIYRPVL